MACIFGDSLREVISTEARLGVIKGRKDVADGRVELTKLKEMMMSPNNLHYQAALFLDPRFNNKSSKVFKDEKQKERVIEFLVKLNKRVKKLKGIATTPEGDKDLITRLQRFSEEEQPDPNIVVLQYWKKRSQSDPEIGELVCAALVVPTPRNANSQFACFCCP